MTGCDWQKYIKSSHLEKDFFFCLLRLSLRKYSWFFFCNILSLQKPSTLWNDHVTLKLFFFLFLHVFQLLRINRNTEDRGFQNGIILVRKVFWWKHNKNTSSLCCLGMIQVSLISLFFVVFLTTKDMFCFKSRKYMFFLAYINFIHIKRDAYELNILYYNI